jgi:hypothetical protein
MLGSKLINVVFGKAENVYFKYTVWTFSYFWTPDKSISNRRQYIN